jgi:hypothetical protein
MTSTGEVGNEGRKFEDNIIIYQALLKDIQFYKNQQWITTYYIFGIYVFLSTILAQQSQKANSLLMIYILMIVCLVVMLGGVKLLIIYEEELTRSRARKDDAINLLHKDIQTILLKPRVVNSENNNNQSILNTLITVIVGGFAFVFIFALTKLFS